jgi:glycosyltransferase involved in cell wall biosynthesis
VTPIRLTVLLTHPIQYYSPWFRHIAQSAPELALTVVYGTRPTQMQQGVGFGRAFEWDLPLTEGYRSIVIREARDGDRVDASSFLGLDVPGIGRAIAETDPEVVLIPGWHSIALVRALASCRARGIPILYRGDSQLLSGPRGWRRVVWASRTWALLNQFDGYLSPGRRVDEYLRWFGVDADSVFRVPHAVDNDRIASTASAYAAPRERAAARAAWGVDADAFVPLFAGKLVPSKRPLNVIRAAARLGSGVTVLIVGAGPLELAMRTEAERLNVDVRFTGFLNQTEIGRAYAVADVLSLPSDAAETWGLVVNEALATGLPCVVSDEVGCAIDLIHEGETGYLHPLDDVDAQADRFEKVRQRTRDGHNWRPACRGAVAEYSFPMMTAGLIAACRFVVAPRRHVAHAARVQDVPQAH